jgi:hypothetical protein
MQNQTTLSKLSEKVSEIVDRYNLLKEENETLRIEVVKLTAQSEAKSKEIEKLVEENSLKDLEIEEIVQKIESLMV